LAKTEKGHGNGVIDVVRRNTSGILTNLNKSLFELMMCKKISNKL